MRYVIGSGLCVLGSFIAALVAPACAHGFMLAHLFIFASTFLLFVGTLRPHERPRR